jgi:hypothetical protein
MEGAGPPPMPQENIQVTRNVPWPVVRIRDVYPRIRIFSIPDPGSQIQFRILVKKFKYFNPKMVSKLSEIWSGMFVPDPDLDFSPIPDPGVKKAPDPGSGSATLQVGALKVPWPEFKWISAEFYTWIPIVLRPIPEWTVDTHFFPAPDQCWYF